MTKTTMMKKMMLLMSRTLKWSTMTLKSSNYSKRKLANKKMTKMKAMKTTMMITMTQPPRVSCIILKLLRSTSPKNLKIIVKESAESESIPSISSSLHETAHWCSTSLSGSVCNFQEKPNK